MDSHRRLVEGFCCFRRRTYIVSFLQSEPSANIKRSSLAGSQSASSSIKVSHIAVFYQQLGQLSMQETIIKYKTFSKTNDLRNIVHILDNTGDDT